MQALENLLSAVFRTEIFLEDSPLAVSRAGWKISDLELEFTLAEHVQLTEEQKTALESLSELGL